MIYIKYLLLLLLYTTNLMLNSFVDLHQTTDEGQVLLCAYIISHLTNYTSI